MQPADHVFQLATTDLSLPVLRTNANMQFLRGIRAGEVSRPKYCLDGPELTNDASFNVGSRDPTHSRT